AAQSIYFQHSPKVLGLTKLLDFSASPRRSHVWTYQFLVQIEALVKKPRCFLCQLFPHYRIRRAPSVVVFLELTFFIRMHNSTARHNLVRLWQPSTYEQAFAQGLRCLFAKGRVHKRLFNANYPLYILLGTWLRIFRNDGITHLPAGFSAS